MDEYQNDLRQINLMQTQIENSPINMQELFDSIEEIISTPDISFYLESPDYDNLNMILETLKIDEPQNATKSLDIKVEMDECKNKSMPVKEEVKEDIQNMETKNTLKSKLLQLNPKMTKRTSLPEREIENRTFNNQHMVFKSDEHRIETINLKLFHSLTMAPGVLDDMLLELLDNALGVDKKILKKRKLVILKKPMIQGKKFSWDGLAQLFCERCGKMSSAGAGNGLYRDKICRNCGATELQVQCTKCPKRYKTLRSAYKHVKYECEPSFQCTECDHKASYPRCLERHMRSKHAINKEDGVTMHQCTKCHKSYKTGRYFSKHKCLS